MSRDIAQFKLKVVVVGQMPCRVQVTWTRFQLADSSGMRQDTRLDIQILKVQRDIGKMCNTVML